MAAEAAAYKPEVDQQSKAEQQASRAARARADREAQRLAGELERQRLAAEQAASEYNRQQQEEELQQKRSELILVRDDLIPSLSVKELTERIDSAQNTLDNIESGVTKDPLGLVQRWLTEDIEAYEDRIDELAPDPPILSPTTPTENDFAAQSTKEIKELVSNLTPSSITREMFEGYSDIIAGTVTDSNWVPNLTRNPSFWGSDIKGITGISPLAYDPTRPFWKKLYHGVAITRRHILTAAHGLAWWDRTYHR